MENCIKNNLPKILKEHIYKLKETSEDNSIKDSIQYMTESTIEVINFDKVATEYKKISGINNIPKSNDALYISKDYYYFIEFKNGRLKKNIIQFNGKINGKINGKVNEQKYTNRFEGYINGNLFDYIKGNIENNNHFNGYVNSKFDGYIDGINIDNNENIKGVFKGNINAKFDGHINYINVENDLKEKIYDSIFILSNISKEFNINIPKISNNIIYILVYNKEKNSNKKIFRYDKKNKAKKDTSILSFPQIDNLKNYLLKEVNYLTEDNFEKFIKENFIE
ncbi:hypothetical protein JQ824_13085 [Brachyspira hyodysenteriae]|uniref:Uncharacterized protein n=1 Tax=Brachyspira hyodysenteriae (strain ATCC 49526 / WA1) TaxID=565034 RepID=A0A3B6VCM5_BRAHW|nr:hypothetical protein [Brachyspira hyodysenteriae]ACN83933.1 hypothetical protein BHWA1_01461 [Brachyspira hyodysenteriae WA1]KLI16200.1 hypothetical protein SU45_07975 [Brachyspira hyodysenteriae]KLI31419.1 hypothetical protein SZ49_04015 [Brachyspira hyodysenteriae]KLI34076.1 hypothetical protein SZ48_06615 [Brachyspira hyodysenteriae]KLI41091.1 hypothetical protein SZ40_13165 [Brachyspira hyodysenteriae]